MFGGRSSEFYATIEDLLEKNKNLNEDIKSLKREHEMHPIRLCEVMEQKKKLEDDKAMVDEENRQMAIRLDERINEVKRITKNQFSVLIMIFLERWKRLQI